MNIDDFIELKEIKKQSVNIENKPKEIKPNIFIKKKEEPKKVENGKFNGYISILVRENKIKEYVFSIHMNSIFYLFTSENSAKRGNLTKNNAKVLKKDLSKKEKVLFSSKSIREIENAINSDLIDTIEENIKEIAKSYFVSKYDKPHGEETKITFIGEID